MSRLDGVLGVTKALSDRNRVRLLLALTAYDELCACQLTALAGVTGATVSRHLAILVQAGLVESRKEGRWIHYRLRRCAPGETCPRLHMLDWLGEELAEDPVILGDRRELERIVALAPRTLCRQQRGGKPRVLFLCTGNSCRSQMAEGWARALRGDVLEPYSAGIETHGLNPWAVRVMAEAGVDISGHRSKLLDDLRDVSFDWVVTVCGHAHETCPLFPGGARVVHVGFDDPPKLARTAATEEDRLDCYRRVRDEIRRFVETLPESLTQGCTGG